MIAAGQDDPFVSAAAAPGLRLSNPIADPLSRLRRSLAAGLVASVDANLRQGARDIRLFEVGHVFLARPGETFPDERPRVGLAWCGAAEPRHWSAAPRPVTLPAIAGVVEDLLGRLRPGFRLRREPPVASLPAGFHPGRTVVWTAGDGPVDPVEAPAWAAALHPDLARQLDLAAEVFVAEIDLGRLLDTAAEPWTVRSLPKVPAVARDLSLVLRRGLAFARVQDVLESEPSPAPVRWEIVDRYEGAPLAPGEASVTVRGILQPLEQTLTDAEAEAFRARVVARLAEELGVALRE
jgi:phenylalanyl-tRNA synthetase beta chain